MFYNLCQEKRGDPNLSPKGPVTTERRSIQSVWKMRPAGAPTAARGGACAPHFSEVRLGGGVPVDGAHVAFFGEGEVHGEGGAEGLRGVGVAGQRHVVAQEGAVVGMGAVFDDGLGPLGRGFCRADRPRLAR